MTAGPFSASVPRLTRPAWQHRDIVMMSRQIPDATDRFGLAFDRPGGGLSVRPFHCGGERVLILARARIIPLNHLVTYGGFCEEVDNTHFPIAQNLNARRLP